METPRIIESLMNMYREAEADFDAANRDGSRAVEFARIIGAMMGNIAVLAIELGYSGSLATPNPARDAASVTPQAEKTPVVESEIDEALRRI